MNWVLPDRDEWCLPVFSSGVIIGDNCYMARSDKSGIFRWDIKNNHLELLHLNESFVNYSYLYGNCIFHDGKIYFIPCVADELLVYKLNGGTWEHFLINTKLCKSDSMASFFGGYVFDGKLWLVPKDSRCIASFDIIKSEFEYRYDFFEKVSSLYNESWPHIVRTQTFALGSIWMLLWESNVVIRFCLKDGTTEVHIVGEEGEQFRNIAFDEDCFWLSNQFGRLLRWKPGNGVERIYDILGRTTEISFKLVGNNIWVFPLHCDEYAVLEAGSREICKRKYVDVFDSLVQAEYFGGNVVYIMPSIGRRYLRTIKINDYSIVEHSLCVSEEDLQRYQNAFLKCQPNMVSERDYSLQMFLERLNCCKSIFTGKYQEALVGKIIYDSCFREDHK